jgi:hypothetical protein
MEVGKIPRGNFRGLEEDVAIEKFYKIMDVDLNCTQELHIAKLIEDRGMANSSFEGENHFKFKLSNNFQNQDHNKSYMEES